MAFSFGFSGDDIDIDDSEINNNTQDALVPTENSNSLPELVKASKHDMDEWVSLKIAIGFFKLCTRFCMIESNYPQLSILPSQIFYNRLAISGTPFVVGRREVIDIRTQLMAEDTADHENAELIAGIEEGDLKPNFYEGGFKTWECSLDLAKLVAGDETVTQRLNDSQTHNHIIEVR